MKRYIDEVKRVLSVLEDILKNQEWLVANKVTIADLSFITWNNIAFQMLLKDEVDGEKEYPKTFAWNQKLNKLPYVAVTMADREKALAK